MPVLNWFIRLLGGFLPVSAYRHRILDTPEGIRISLDSPRNLRPKKREFLLRGWCYCKSQRIQAMRIITPHGRQKTRYGIERYDLLEVFQTQSESMLYSGFEVPLNVPRGSTRFTLEAQMEDNSWQPVITEYLTRPLLDFLDRDGLLNSRHPYVLWTQEHDQLSPEDRRLIVEHTQNLDRQPLISIVVPTYNTEVRLLDKMIQSVINQLYENWELCIADDNSTKRSTRRRLELWQKQDERIKVCFRTDNGHISACSNSAIELATGEFIALLDHDDELAPHALYWVALEIDNHPDCQVIYSDEDKISADGYRTEPYFKPDFGTDLLCSHNFVSHLGVYRSELIRQVGGFREEFVGSQDWDLVLRCLDHVEEKQIRHIPRILYHWRQSEQSTSASMRNKRYAVDSGRRALEEYLSKHEVHASVQDGPTMGSFRIHYDTPGNPLVSIIVLTKNNGALLKRCVDSIQAITGYEDYELIIVDNGSDEPQSKALLSSMGDRKKVRVFEKPLPFNFSLLNNWAVKMARGDILLFLNNDIEVIEEDWLREMVSQAMRKKVGPVGAKLIFPDDYVQHAGMILGIGGLAGHAFKFLHRNNPGHIGRASIIQNYSAVTAACMAIRRKVFDELGGFDEDNLGTAYNDADLCLRAWEKGYRTVWTPYALIVHHESASRGLEDNFEKKRRWQSEADYMRTKWNTYIEHDPFYNPALSLTAEDFSLAKPPRYIRPWITPRLAVTIKEVSHRLRVNSYTVTLDLLMPHDYTLSLKLGAAPLNYIDLQNEVPDYEPSEQEVVRLIGASFIPASNDLRLSVHITPKSSNKSIRVLTLPIAELKPDTLEQPFLFDIDGIFDRAAFETKVVSGWCFAVNPLKVSKIQARLDDQPLNVEHHLPRKGTADHYPEQLDSENCGFECELPPGKEDGTLILECRLESASWVEFYQSSIQAIPKVNGQPDHQKSAQIAEHQSNSVYHVETIYEEQQKGLKTKLIGWIFLKDGPPIKELRILMRDKTLKCRYGLQRGDVFQEFPSQTNAIYSGFETRVDDIPGNPTLQFQYKTENSQWITFDQRKPAQIRKTFYTDKKISQTKSGVKSNVEHAQIGRRYGHQFLIIGWCFRVDGETVTEVRIRTGKNTFPGKAGLRRGDVYEKNKDDFENCLNSGFEIPLDDIPRKSVLKFEYKISGGRWTLFAVEGFSRFPVSHFASKTEEKQNYQIGLKSTNQYFPFQILRPPNASIHFLSAEDFGPHAGL